MVSAGSGENSRDSIDSDDAREVAAGIPCRSGTAREERVAREQDRRAVEAEAHRARGMPRREHGVQPQASDLDRRLVFEQVVVARQHPGIARRDRHTVAHGRGPAGPPVCDPNARVSRARGARRAGGRGRAIVRVRWRHRSIRLQPVWRHRNTYTLLSTGPTTTMWISAALSCQTHVGSLTLTDGATGPSWEWVIREGYLRRRVPPSSAARSSSSIVSQRTIHPVGPWIDVTSGQRARCDRVSPSDDLARCTRRAPRRSLLVSCRPATARGCAPSGLGKAAPSHRLAVVVVRRRTHPSDIHAREGLVPVDGGAHVVGDLHREPGEDLEPLPAPAVGAAPARTLYRAGRRTSSYRWGRVPSATSRRRARRRAAC